MTYAGHRRIIDVDSHLFETEDFLAAVASEAELAKLPAMDAQSELPVVLEAIEKGREHLAARKADPAVMAKFEDKLLEVGLNPWGKLGAFDSDERSHVMDLFGFEAQLVLPTFSFHQICHETDHDVLENGARLLNRAMARFCADDPRLHAIGYVPLELGPERALAVLEDAYADGCYSAMIPTNEPNPDARSFTHPAFDPVWARIAASGAPFAVHVAANGEYDAVSPSFKNNDRSVVALGGDAPAGALGFASIHNSAELFLTAMIFDGVFERHEGLRCISMEHGATWLPGWLQRIDFVAASMRRVDPRDRLPSVVARERIRVSPFAGEPVGSIIEQVGPDMLVFASDYPHPEGSRDPIGKMEATMETIDDAAMERFYHGNMADFMRGAPSVAVP